MGTIKVFGHLSPDTDTICSAIIWSWYLNTHTKMKATPYMLGEPNKETQFVLTHWGVEKPALLELRAGDDVVIVDTNNPQELPENIGETNIIALIDHHKLVGGLATKSPLDVTIRPLASTASVMYELMGDAAEKIPKEIAGLVLSCILSDTLEFRSPTTTPRDQEITEKLAQKFGIDMHTLAGGMFAAKSDVSDFSDAQLINLDSKKYAVGGKNLLVSSIETTSPALVLARKEGLAKAMRDAVKRGGIDEVLLFIIDILKEEATVLTHNDLTKRIIEKSFGKKTEGDTVVLPGVVSRKKQILPVLKI